MHIKDSEILDAISAQIAVLDEAGIIRAVNDAWVRFARRNGAPEGENYIGQNYVGICEAAEGEGAEGSQQVARGLQKVLDGTQKEFEIEYPCHSPEERRWFVMRASAIPGEKGGAVVAHINITSQKLIQRMMQGVTRDLEGKIRERTEKLEYEASVRRLAEEESRFRADHLEGLVAAFPDYVWSFKVQMHAGGRAEMEMQSPSVERITGYSADHFSESPSQWMEIILDEDRPLMEASLDEVIRGVADSKEVDFRIQHRSGELRWLNTHFVSRNRSEESVRIVGVTADITERRRSEEALKKRNEFIEKAASSLPGILFVRNLESARNSYISGRNSAFTAQDLERDISPFGGRIHPDDLTAVEKVRAGLLQGDGNLHEFVYRCRFAEGAWRWLRCRCLALAAESGSIEEILGYVEDITEEKENDIRLLQTGKDLEKAMLARDRFVANISHEIRTPIFAILGISDLLYRSLQDAEARKYLKIVRNSGNTLLQLLNDILEFSRLESGELPLEKIPLNPVKQIQEALDPYIYRAREKGLEFNVDMGEKVPETVLSDPLRIKQIVANLVSNAVKFTESGEIRVQVDVNESSEISARPVGEELILELVVSDSGIGISRDQHQNIFEVFRQSDESINRRFGGSGLGLSIVKHLVDLLGGTVELESPSRRIWKSGPGADFTVRFPVRRCESSGQTEDRAEPEVLHFAEKKRILLAEDNQVNLMLLEKFLADMNCDVVALEDGLKAVRYMDTDNRFDAILMDVNMPVMGGYEATRALRDAGHEVPIIGITADVFKEDIARCLESGMNDHLGKPIWPEDLFATLSKWIS